MRVQLTIDLNRILTPPARDALEQYFGHFPPDEDKAVKTLGLSKEEFDVMLAYMVKKTILEDDETHVNFKVVG